MSSWKQQRNGRWQLKGETGGKREGTQPDPTLPSPSPTSPLACPRKHQLLPYLNGTDSVRAPKRKHAIMPEPKSPQLQTPRKEVFYVVLQD